MEEGTARESATEVATEIWRLLSDFTGGQFREKARALGDLGLTPGHTKALLALEPGQARPMGSCAHGIGCDASTATWLIDRLEERGLVERHPSVTDRRVKTVLLTPLGVRTRERLRKHHYEPPPALLQLDRESLDRLLKALTRLNAVSGACEEANRQ